MSLYNYEATVVKVIDGDTVDLTVDLGFHVNIDIRTRLLGINAPEVSTQEGRDARDKLRAHAPIGTAVAITTHKDAGDKYGRWLATITLEGDTISINDWMIAQGLAVAWDGKGVKP